MFESQFEFVVGLTMSTTSQTMDSPCRYFDATDYRVGTLRRNVEIFDQYV